MLHIIMIALMTVFSLYCTRFQILSWEKLGPRFQGDTSKVRVMPMLRGDHNLFIYNLGSRVPPYTLPLYFFQLDAQI